MTFSCSVMQWGFPILISRILVLGMLDNKLTYVQPFFRTAFLSDTRLQNVVCESMPSLKPLHTNVSLKRVVVSKSAVEAKNVLAMSCSTTPFIMKGNYVEASILLVSTVDCVLFVSLMKNNLLSPSFVIFWLRCNISSFVSKNGHDKVLWTL